MDEPALFDTEGNRSRRSLTKIRIRSIRPARGGLWWLKAVPQNAKRA